VEEMNLVFIFFNLKLKKIFFKGGRLRIC